MTEFQANSLTDRFHSLGVFEGYHVRREDLALSATWQLAPVNMLNLLEADYDAYSQHLLSLLNILPEHTEIQLIYNIYPTLNQDKSLINNTHPNIRFFSKQRKKALQPYLKVDTFLVVTFNHLNPDFRRKRFNTIFFLNPKKHSSILKESFYNRIQDIKPLEQQIESELEFLSPVRLDSRQIIKSMSDYYNLSNDFDHQFYIREDHFNNDLMFKSISRAEGGRVAIGQDNLLNVSLAELPSFIENPVFDGRVFKNPIAQFFFFLFESRLVTSFYKIPQTKAVAQLKRLKNSRNAFASINPIAAQTIYEIDGDEKISGLLNDLETGHDSLYEFGLNVFTWHPSNEVLKQREFTIVSQFEKFFGAVPLTENEDSLHLFLGSAPGNFVNHYRTNLIRGSNLVHFLNISGHYKGMNTGITFKNLDEEIILYDLFCDEENENYNAIIVGPAGSGKSFFCASMILKYLEQGTNIAILDIGGSYRQIVDSLEGDYIDINAENPVYLDPLYYFDPLKYKYESKEYLEAIKTIQSFIEVMVLREGEIQLEKDKRSIFFQVIKDFFKQSKSSSTLHDLISFLREDPNFFQADPDYKRYLFDALNLYLKGPLEPYFSPKNENRLKLEIKRQASLIAFDLKGIEKEMDLLPLFTFLITRVVTNLMEESLERFLFIQDEAWKFLEISQAIRDYTINCYRTGRKENSGIIAISQDSGSFNQGKLAQGIMGNSDSKFLLRHKTDQIPITLDTFNLSDAQELTFRNLKQHEIFVLHNNEPVVLNVHFSPEDYWLFTTRGKDKIARNNMLERCDNNLIRTVLSLKEQGENIEV